MLFNISTSRWNMLFKWPKMSYPNNGIFCKCSNWQCNVISFRPIGLINHRRSGEQTVARIVWVHEGLHLHTVQIKSRIQRGTNINKRNECTYFNVTGCLLVVILLFFTLNSFNVSGGNERGNISEISDPINLEMSQLNKALSPSTASTKVIYSSYGGYIQLVFL